MTLQGTHFWFRPRILDVKLFESWIAECRAVINAKTTTSTAIRGPDGRGEPVLTNKRLAINGDAAGGLAGDAFEIAQSRKPHKRDMFDHQGLILQSCRAADQPYGRVVAECLAAFEKLFGPEVHAHINSPGYPILSRFRWLSPIIEITDDTFAELLARPGFALVVYDIASEEYRNADRLRAAVRRVAKQFHDRLTVLIFDDYMCPESNPQFSRSFLPGIFLHRDGKLIDGQGVLRREQDVEELVSAHLH